MEKNEKDILEGIIKNIKEKKKKNNKIEKEIEKQIDKETKKHIRIEQKKEDTIIIYTESSIWSYQLKLKQKSILENLKKSFPKTKNIQIKVGRL